jgi:hypothetical protein
MASTTHLDRTIAESAANPEECRVTQALARALSERSASLGGGGLPADNAAVSERILAEARVRSARISDDPVGDTVATPGIPWWLWLAWAVAIVGAVVAWRYVG